MKTEPLQKLYIMQLKDLYSAERQLIQALPKMAKAATTTALVDAFMGHLKETETHIERIVKVLEYVGSSSPGGHKFKAMEGLIEEGKEIIEMEAPPETIDIGLIAAAQRVEHYEIAAYGCTRRIAELLGYTEAVELLQLTLNEESATNEALTKVAEDDVYTQVDIMVKTVEN